jgi:hypothetical protein
MPWSPLTFHDPVLADVMTFTSEGVPLVSLTFRDANRQECKIITPHITAAIAAADAFNAEVSRSKKPKPVLVFEDFFGGCGKAKTEGGYFLVSPLHGDGWQARFAAFGDEEWAWDGGYFGTAEAAQAACEAHYRGENGPVTA